MASPQPSSVHPKLFNFFSEMMARLIRNRDAEAQDTIKLLHALIHQLGDQQAAFLEGNHYEISDAVMSRGNMDIFHALEPTGVFKLSLNSDNGGFIRSAIDGGTSLEFIEHVSNYGFSWKIDAKFGSLLGRAADLLRHDLVDLGVKHGSVINICSEALPPPMYRPFIVCLTRRLNGEMVNERAWKTVIQMLVHGGDLDYGGSRSVTGRMALEYKAIPGAIGDIQALAVELKREAAAIKAAMEANKAADIPGYAPSRQRAGI